MVESGWWLDTKSLTALMTMVRLDTSYYLIVTSAEYNNYHLIAVLSPLNHPPPSLHKHAHTCSLPS